jgi:hypothetical protein
MDGFAVMTQLTLMAAALLAPVYWLGLANAQETPADRLPVHLAATR